MSKKTRTLGLTVILFTLLIACATSNTVDKDTPDTKSEVIPTATPLPAPATLTPAPEPPTSTPEPPTPAPAYQQSVILLEYSAVGEAVSDNFTLPACQKAVFNYSVQSSDIGYASISLKLNKVGKEGDISLVNDMEETPQMTGQVLQVLTGGDYYFSSENTDEPWRITLECHDNAAPVADGIDLQGEAPTVSQNYRLSDCQKSVFIWESQPGSTGYASLSAALFRANDGDLRYDSLVSDMTEGVLSGETLQSVEDGDYFIGVKNTNEPWRIRWECRD